MGSISYYSRLIVIVIILSISASLQGVFADVTLHKIFSDNMVLQRDADIKIWGWADADESITLTFNDQVEKTTAGENGKWQVILDPIPAGGPYELSVEGKNKIVHKNILMGEVWICSGQSNMQWSVLRSKNPEEEIANANHPKIRLFTVKRIIAQAPKENLTEGEWQICQPSTIEQFSAVGYFFGRELNKSLDVPIGLISTNWGGTVSETWTSREAIKVFPEFKLKLDELDKIDIEDLYKNRDKLEKEWANNLEKGDQGLSKKWYEATSVASDWKKMAIPQLWEDAGLKKVDGIVWCFKEINLSKEEANQELTLSLGPIDDSDFTYFNGKLVGSTERDHNKPRQYQVPAELLKEGQNWLCVRVIDYGGGGGIWGVEEHVYYSFSEEKKVSLVGDWYYQIATESLPKLPKIGPNSYPTLLFNAMINPILPFSIKGAIWYQGESNAGRAYQYRDIFPAMITDWRTHWGLGDFPFLFVQLANFKKAADEPGDSNWAELREAQSMTLKLPNTGMAVIIDIGEADDIHPRNKQDVGYRLAQNARKIAYDQDIVYTGPLYKSMEIDGNKIRLSFTNTGSGLMIKDRYGYLKGFSIAGVDKKFVWAKARIEGDGYHRPHRYR